MFLHLCLITFSYFNKPEATDRAHANGHDHTEYVLIRDMLIPSFIADSRILSTVNLADQPLEFRVIEIEFLDSFRAVITN